MEGGQKTLEEPLRHGDESVHVVHKYLTPYDADEQRYVPFEETGGRIRCLEWAIVALNVVNVLIYLIEWTGATVVGVIVIFFSRTIMLGCTVALCQGNWNQALFFRQFGRKNQNRFANIGIVINLLVCAIVRLWIQFLDDGTPYSDKTWWYIPYQISYILPYGYFLLLDALHKSSHAFRIFVVAVPLCRLIVDWAYYARTDCGDMNRLKFFGLGLGFGETYLSASSLAIVAAAFPFVINVLSDEFRTKVHLFSSVQLRKAVLAEIAQEG